VGTYPFEQMGAVIQMRTQAIATGVERAVQQIALAGTEVIIDNTPVDTTTAVGNWKITQGEPFGGIMGERIAGSRKGSGAEAARESMKSEAAGRIAFFRNSLPMYLTNNVPYIGVLEYGDAKHRPSGMVAKGLQAMRVRASTVRLLPD
jgi:hypothetical protein